MKLKYYLTLCVLLTIPIPIPSFAVTVGEIINPIDKYLNCETGSTVEKQICLLVRNKVNEILSQSNISFSNGDVLYNYNNGTNRKINTGHSCTYRANITNIQATTVLNSGGSVDFRGNSISKPVVFTIRLPIDLSTRTDIKAKLGTRFLGKCVRLGTDSYYAHANLATTTNLAILFSLEPKLERAANGDYIISIQPIIDVASEITDTSVNLEFHRVSPLASVYLAIVGSTSSIFKGISNILHGGSVKDMFESAFIDIGTGIILTNSVFPVPLLDNYVNNRLTNLADEKISGTANAFSASLERRLIQRMSQVLKLDSNGRRVFVIGKDLKLKIPPPPPAIPLLSMNQYCSDGFIYGESMVRISWRAVSGASIRYELQKGTTGINYQGTRTSVIRNHRIGDAYRIRSCSVYGCGNFSFPQVAIYEQRCYPRSGGDRPPILIP